MILYEYDLLSKSYLSHVLAVNISGFCRKVWLQEPKDNCMSISLGSDVFFLEDAVVRSLISAEPTRQDAVNQGIEL